MELPQLPTNVPDTTSEETRIRKQKERLDNEKKYYKRNSFLTNDRRLSSATNVNDDQKQKSKSSHDKPEKPEKPNIKSKLFDYQKKAPRSRRQLAMDAGTDAPPSRDSRAPQARPSPMTQSAHAGRGSQSQLLPIIGVTTADVATSAQSSRSRLASHSATSTMRSTSRLNSQNEANEALAPTSLEQEASKRKSATQRVSFDENAIKTPTNKTPPTNKAKTLRSQSLPSPSMNVEGAAAGGSADPDEEAQKLQALYNRAIETVQKADESRIQGETYKHAMKSLPSPSMNVEDAAAAVADPDEETQKLQVLYNRAIETVQKAEESRLLGEANKHAIKCSDRRCSVKSHTDVRKKSGLDVTALKELETILQDARLYSSRKSTKEDHSRLDLGSNRAQKKRIQHLEQVLRQLNPNYGTSTEELDPMKVLQCSYLRLSKSNVETLEQMLWQSGRDPGIHIHSDVSNCDIWKGLKQERSDLHTEPSTADSGSKKAAAAKKAMKTS